MMTGQFEIHAQNREGAELIGATEIHYRRSIKCATERDVSRDELEVYDVVVPGYTTTQWPVIPQVPEELPLGRLPKWLRKERRADKRAWRALGLVFKTTPRFDPEYFDPLPEVPAAQLSSGGD
jgi:hypothetical protein